jgi:hypothetical protein
MQFQENAPARRDLWWAILLSVAVHALALFVHRPEPLPTPPPPRIEARLPPRPAITPTELTPPPAESPPKPAAQPAKRPRQLATDKPGKFSVPGEPKFSAAEKAEMKEFIEELATQAKKTPPPSLAERSTRMAREQASQSAQTEAPQVATLELRPNAAPPDPFSLEMYVDSLIKRLNRSAAFVRNDPRNRGLRSASVQFKINPDGSLKSFEVVNAGDQTDEIAFIKAVVEQSIPFAAFPPDINKAARSLTMNICILPARAQGGGFGFTRAADGQRC